MRARGEVWGRQASSGVAGVRTAARTALASLLALALGACAAPSSYLGVAFAPGAADPQVQTLARQARSGDKQAQLALGIRYEAGDGVPTDPKRARKLYRAAAATTGGTIYVYVPATRKGGKGYVSPVNMGPRVAGLAEARERLVAVKSIREGGE
jgi:hypothetical protein